VFWWKAENVKVANGNCAKHVIFSFRALLFSIPRGDYSHVSERPRELKHLKSNHKNVITKIRYNHNHHDIHHDTTTKTTLRISIMVMANMSPSIDCMCAAGFDFSGVSLDSYKQ
jgi:hypothetical protein